MTTPAVDERTALSDLIVALLRTIVPAWWGSLVAWFLAQLAGILPGQITTALADALAADVVRAAVVAIVIGAWYWAWRKLSPHVPDWLVRLALGSVRTPTYTLTPAATSADGQAHVITTVPDLDSASAEEIEEAATQLLALADQKRADVE